LPQPSGVPVGCVFVLEAGRLYGGDSFFYYEGRYEIDNNSSLQASVRVKHYAGDFLTIFGDKKKQYNVRIGGIVVGDKIIATFIREEMPGVKRSIEFVRQEYFP